MMKYTRLFSILFLLSILWLPAFSQQDSIPVTTIVEKVNKQITDIPLEKVYLHMDKPYYAVGDTIWFKAYLTSVQNVPSELSKIVYVDVLSSKDSIVESIKIPVINGVAPGSIPISVDSYKQGNYHVRAYTRWMLNFSSKYFYSKNLLIGNAINKDISTNITFNSTSTDKNVKVTAQVLFQNENNMPLSNQRVNWEVIVDYERIARGRGDTDANGLLNIDFSSSKDVDLRSGELLATIDIGKAKPINVSFPLNKAASENDLQFFPEGGDLVAGLPSVVAFKALRSDGLGVELKGTVVDAEGTIVSEITSQHLGMGKFSFTPESNKIYFANVEFADGSKGTFKLPGVKSEGITVSVDNSDLNNLKFVMRANAPYVEKNFNSGFYVIGRNGGVVYYAAQSVLRNQEYIASIPKKNFPTGIAQLSILSSSGNILSERIVFIKQADSLKMDLTSDLPKYTQRQKVQMKLNASSGGEPSLGSFSVAVIDESKVPVNEDKETTILSSLLLTSDIEGYIEEPNYYFYQVDSKKLSDLDLLMLTQGYRRYTYKDILANKPPAISYLPERSLAVSGTIRRKDGMPLANGRLLLQIPERSFYKDGKTDDKGRFSFTDLAFQDSVEVVINARNNLNSENLMIMTDGEPFPEPDISASAPDEVINIDNALKTYLQNSKLENSSGFLLREVEIEVRAPKAPSHADYGALSGLSMQADYLYKGDQLAGCNNLISCLTGSMGLTYVDRILYLSRSYNTGNRLPIEIYANGLQVDVNYLMGIQVEGIESIEVFNDDGVSGINARNRTKGVLVINMKEVKKTKVSAQDIADLFAPTNVMTFMPNGYSAERQFYVPKYSGPQTTMQSKDNRTTVYWNPYLLTDEKGDLNFEYFNSDGKGTFRVVVEGIDANGHIGRSVYRYQVQ
ncbi:carboxypeptidase-like regulatory domain-containing protein [Albibacterium sp.]|uniref:carboxypeptidase-like regulatory domain-containing protein n=1 Tax=Albibacterium sp. TaxID=2952885 RepID=UPI002CF1B74C|nr:carboxypeptidase-like regulatory domain-containing protein [Albibacterium sp.]HUH18211.1 carboxypeptidase-like regulatory domain-containing protein [Albibacterium sp.]